MTTLSGFWHKLQIFEGNWNHIDMSHSNIEFVRPVHRYNLHYNHVIRPSKVRSALDTSSVPPSIRTAHRFTFRSYLQTWLLGNDRARYSVNTLSISDFTSD